MQRHAWARYFLLGFTALQLLEPAAAQLADARLEAASSRASRATHIEDPTAARCAPVHLADCALCRFLAQAATPPGRTTSTPAIRVVVTRIHERADGLTTCAPSLQPPSRAPPHLV